ncbi:MAG TPA: fused response regulator/phosphatase [Patescibacteria group bacterium]|nr:fused response regulator/phosphatase [Patescibacteria group bacterium]
MRTELDIVEYPSGTKLAGTASVTPTAPSVKVLLIEDNPGDARLIQIMLDEEGGSLFESEWVDRLGAGLKRLSESNFGLVLADLSLPDSRGLDTFLQLHAHAPQLPIIVLSGLRDTTVAVQAVHEGAQDFLIKGQVDGQLLVRSMRYAIERKRLTEQLGHYTQELRTKNAQLEADFNMAREIQEIFLPHQYPAIPRGSAPHDSALAFSHRYFPAAAVGGDFFDVFGLSDTAAGVFICDVMGHGMRAALVTAIMRGLVEELIPIAGDAGRFLSELNRSLHAILRRTREPFLATAFYMVADVAGGELRFANAGHTTPVRLQRSQGSVEPLSNWDPHHGPALGLFEKPEYPTCRCPMAAKDLFLLFTDGIYEASNFEQEEYGRHRLVASLRRHLRLPTENLLDALVQDVQRFASNSEFEDDVCLVGMDVQRLVTL